jgi:CRISPR system Cascade subunit CasE
VTDLHLSRVRLRTDAHVAAIAPLVLPGADDGRVGAAHRLLWSLFADGPDRRRDFLWRDEGGGAWFRRSFLVLSPRPPEDRLGLFDLETKAFEPALAPGDRLRFRLRASPAKSISRPGARRGKRVDPVAHALKAIPREERAAHRYRVASEIGGRWLAAQGAQHGFSLVGGPDNVLRLQVDGDDWRAISRDGAPPIMFSVLDFEGELRVEDPPVFLAALARGFGRAKAFGCGLMLVRRV